MNKHKMQKRYLLALLCLLTIPSCLQAQEMLGGSDAWREIGGSRYLPLRALQLYCDGAATLDSGRVACDFGGKLFKLRLGSENIFIDNSTTQLSCSTASVGEDIYASPDLVHAIGWTYRLTPSGYDIHNPKSAKHLCISRTGWKVALRKNDPSDIKVGVWYMTLFYPKGEGPQYWDAIAKSGRAMPHGGAYLLTDPKVIERQVSQMQECGIDYILMDDTNCVFVDNCLIDRNIRAWFDYMDKLPEDERIPISIAAGGELNQHDSRSGWLEAVDFLWKTYAGRPSYLKDKGKPVLHWYLERDVWTDWTDDRWTIRPTYHFFRTGDQVTHGGWGYGSDENARCIEECLSFHPGWDLSPPGHLREDGEFYRRMWMNAVACNPRHVLIACWNGWNEGDAIEDSDTWKDTYGEIAPSWYRLLTQGYVAAYRGTLLDGFYYRDQAMPHVYQWSQGQFIYQGEFPHKIPVITLPAGKLAQSAGKALPSR